MQKVEQESCSSCGMPVYDEDWLSCPFCGERLGVSAGFISGLTRGSGRLLGAVLAILLLLGLLWLLL